MDNLIGQQLGNYRVDALLGEGAMGAVYKAFDLNLARPVALKVMHNHITTEKALRQRFLQEAQAAARLKYPSIVDIYFFGDEKDVLYMVMAFVAGPSLGHHISHARQMGEVINLRETLSVIAQIADALGYAHRHGVVHGDIKPDNIMLEPLDLPDRPGDPPLRAILTDFGLARLMEEQASRHPEFLKSALPYMSPEQCAGEGIDGRSDIYSLGVLLYHMTTGQLPYHVRSLEDALRYHAHETPAKPRDVRPELPAIVEAIVVKAMAKEPEERIQKAEQLALALRQVAGKLTEEHEARLAAVGPILSLTMPLSVISEDPFTEQRTRVGMNMPEGAEEITVQGARDDPYTVVLRKQKMSIGRSVDNDIALNDLDISRNHAYLERFAAGWAVVDLGSTNGTFLDGTQITPHAPELWMPHQTLQIGPFTLRRQGARPMGMPQPPVPNYQAAYQAVLPQGATQIQSSTGQLSVVVNPTRLEVTPGKEADLQVELMNLGRAMDRFEVRLAELPAGWFTIPQRFVQLLPGAKASIPITIHPPEDAKTRAGQHDYKLTVRSVSNKDEEASVAGQVSVKAFEKYSVTMYPQRVVNGGVSRIQIRNDGNVETTFTLLGRDAAERVSFDEGRRQVKLGAGQTEVVSLQVASMQRPWVGRDQLLPFEVVITDQSGHEVVKAGQMEVRPRWSLLIVAFIIVMLMLIAAAALVFMPKFMAPEAQAQVPLLAGLGSLFAAGEGSASVIKLPTVGLANGRQSEVQLTLESITVLEDSDRMFYEFNGEIWLDIDINGQTVRWPESGTKSVEDGKTYPINQTILFQLGEEDALALRVTGTDRDDFQAAHDSLGVIQRDYSARDDWGTGHHTEQSNCPDGCFVLDFTITSK